MAAAAAPLIGSGISGILGLIGGSKGQTSTSASKSTSEQTANLDPKQTRMNKQLFQNIINAIRQGPTMESPSRTTATC